VSTALAPDLQLAQEVAQFYGDPLGFVLFAYPWGVPGSRLADRTGPDRWQRNFLEAIGRDVRARRFDGNAPVMAIRKAASSGHGIGKSTMAAWLTDWIMSTRPHSLGTITANTFLQLETKTWAAVKFWTSICITGHWFDVNDRRMSHRDYRDTWFCTPQSCREENSEAFAGQHAAGSASFYIFDEASAIPDKIFEVAEGGLTDGEPMVFLFGNPTRNTGAFHAACFGAGRDLWSPIVVDSRESALTNKAQLKEWVDTYGEDSDFVRVRVRGLAPRASELQFIDQERVWQAQKRPLPVVFGDQALVAGVDVSDGGAAWNVVRFRRGLDARTIPPIRIPGEKVRNDRSALLGVLSEILTHGKHGQPVSAMFFDSAFGAPYVERLKAMGFSRVVHEVRFGAESLDRHQLNMRAYMWSQMKEWLSAGAIDSTDERLATDLVGPGYHINSQDRLVIESKEDMAKRGLASPDDGDALALTFAAQVAAPKAKGGSRMPTNWAWS
jgi:hypothetical protein